MIELLIIIAQLIFIMLALAVLGAPLLFLLKRYVMPDSDINVVQALVMSVYFGAVLLYILALIPLHLFEYEVIIVMLFSSLVLALTCLTVSIKRDRGHLLIKLKRDLLEILLALVLFLTSLTVQAVPLTILIFGSIHDTSLHALFTQLIIENGCIPETHEPYMPAAIIFPQGAHVVFAFSSLILNITPPLAVSRITPLFNALTTLAAYHFGRALDRRRYAGVSYAFIFALVSMWPTHITWGGNTFIVGVPLFIIAATFLKQAIYPRDLPLKRVLFHHIIVGLLLGYLAAIHLALFLTLVLCWFLLMLVTRKSIPKAVRGLKHVAISLIISIALISPFLYRFIAYHHLPGGNIGLPPDIANPEASLIPITDPRITLERVKDFILTMPTQYNISPYPLTRFMTIGLSFLVVLTLAIRALRKRQIALAEVVGSVLCLASVLLFFTEPINPVPTLSQRAELVLYISLMLLWGSFNLFLAEGIRNRVSLSKTVISAILILVILASLYSPFIYYRMVEDSWRLTKMYGIFAVTTEDDYNLMLWMKNNLPQNSTILINPFEPGLFIPALSQKRAIYPFSAYHLSASYGKVVNLLINDTLNSYVFNYLDSMNITHVYVGSKSTPLVEILKGKSMPSKWDPYLFLGNPNFKLVKRIGNAFLFEYSPVDPHMVLMDGFEYNSFDEGGWRIAEHGNGTGSVTISNDSTFEGLRSLVIKSKAEEGSYWISVLRPVYVPDSTNVTLAFYIDATRGFGPKDSLMIIVSDERWDKQLYFVTNPTVPIKYPPIHLPSPKGYFEFNLSNLWEELHGEPLPKSFYIQVLNYDVDGVENVAHVDAIAVGINKSHIFAPYSAKLIYELDLSDSPIYGWKYCEQGNGTGMAQISKERIISIAQRSEGWYWSSIYTDVRLMYWRDRDIFISFFVNATKGFSESDALMIIISDPSWKKQTYFSTSSRVPVPPHLVILISEEGLHKIDLSNIWMRIHGEPLPSRFFLQVLNYDRDGIKNVAFVSTIEVEVN